jgi:hypothetical protein
MSNNLILGSRTIKFEVRHINKYKWNSARIITDMRCDHCKQFKPLDDFNTRRNTPISPCSTCREKIESTPKTKVDSFIEKFSEETYNFYEAISDRYINKNFINLIDYFLENYTISLCEWSFKHYLSKFKENIEYNNTELMKIVRSDQNLIEHKSLLRFLKINIPSTYIANNSDESDSKKLRRYIYQRNIDKAINFSKEQNLRSIDISNMLAKAKCDKDRIKAFAHILIDKEFDYRLSDDILIFLKLIRATRTIVESDYYKVKLNTLSSNIKYYSEIQKGETPTSVRKRIYKKITDLKDEQDSLKDYLTQNIGIIKRYKDEIPEEVTEIIINAELD